jgi:hypothetical protein
MKREGEEKIELGQKVQEMKNEFNMLRENFEN